MGALSPKTAWLILLRETYSHHKAPLSHHQMQKQRSAREEEGPGPGTITSCRLSRRQPVDPYSWATHFQLTVTSNKHQHDTDIFYCYLLYKNDQVYKLLVFIVSLEPSYIFGNPKQKKTHEPLGEAPQQCAGKHNYAQCASSPAQHGDEHRYSLMSMRRRERNSALCSSDVVCFISEKG